MNFDIVISTRPNLQNLQRLLLSIKNQSLKPKSIYILIDKILTQQEYIYYQNILTETELITNINTAFLPNQWVSYVRNFGIKNSKSEYLFILDDDTEFTLDFTKNILYSYMYIWQIQKKDFLLFPTVKFANTNNIQTQWYATIHYWMMWPEPIHKKNDIKSMIWHKIFGWIYLSKPNHDHGIYSYQQICCCPSICIFGKRQIFVDNLYDERMSFVYEDLDMTTKITNKWIYIYNLTNIYINHYESQKTKLQASFLDIDQIYNKSKNRILFVKNNANFLEKLLFYFIWFTWQMLRFILFVIFFSKKKLLSIKLIFKGSIDGLLWR